MSIELWLWLVIGAGILALIYGAVTVRSILSASPGNERMQEIAKAIQEGANAYLKRQYTTIAIVGAVVFVAVFFLLGWQVAVGFLIGAILSGVAGAFALTITPPGTLLGFLALVSALGDWAPESGDWLGAGELVLGVIGGSFLWWLMIASLVAKLRDHLDDHWLERVNWFAGGLLITFGLVILIRLGLIYGGLL